MPPSLQNPHANAVLSALTDAGIEVGDHVAPPDAIGRYSVLYMIAGPPPDGSLANPDDETDFRFQVTSVGRLPEEARFEADAVHQALQEATVTVAGRSVFRVRLQSGTVPVRRDEDTDPPTFYAAAVYGMWSVPT